MVKTIQEQTPAQKRASRKYRIAMRITVFVGVLVTAVVAVPLALGKVAENAKLLGYDQSFTTALLWMMVTVGLGYSSINTMQKVGLAVAQLVSSRKKAE